MRRRHIDSDLNHPDHDERQTTIQDAFNNFARLETARMFVNGYLRSIQRIEKDAEGNLVAHVDFYDKFQPDVRSVARSVYPSTACFVAWKRRTSSRTSVGAGQVRAAPHHQT